MLDALTLLRAMNGIHEEDVIMVEKKYYGRREAGNTKKIIYISLLAAVLISLFTAGAYAAFFSMTRRFPEASETFRINWEPNPSGYLDWSNAKLAITFPETPESKEIEFRPGWLPDEMASLKSESWCGRLTAEGLAFGDPAHSVPAYQNMMQPLLIESYSMSQFNNGGALLLLYYIPDEIIEEHWDKQGVDVMRFHCTEHFDAQPERNMDAYTLEQDIILLSNYDAGWVVRICGEAGMDTLLKVAENLEIRETGRTWHYDDFNNHYAFMDGGVG